MADTPPEPSPPPKASLPWDRLEERPRVGLSSEPVGRVADHGVDRALGEGRQDHGRIALE